ncbi:MAG: exodeoxyribonuclease V subunit gamma [Rubrivivax sp.]|nr:exodeoxyribonuclease V subunit gamma [Rubrivivax sp.]
MTTNLRPGLLILQGNRLEDLAGAVLGWLAAHPPGPLEAESFLVQSNGMAEWLKMEIASAHGVCAATRVELPARFIWRAYRAVLGRAAVPPMSVMDKGPLTWRLMHLLPTLAGEPGFEPVAGFLADGDAARRLQLAQRLADLYDQYQVYRSDWLADWDQGRDQIRGAESGATGTVVAVPDDQRWQPALWRAAGAGLSDAQAQATRPLLHRRFLQALQQGGHWPQLPRRVVLFGTTHIPHQTLEAIAALSSHCQVLMAVPNPCRFHWADIIDGRELLRAAQRRHPLRQGRDLACVPLQDMHAHGHPLLAAWGRQGRDFVRQLDAFDDVQQAQARFELPRVDLFDEGPGDTLLAQVQARIRDLVPLAEHERTALPDTDRSLVFHVAHSAQREVEILHDQLLHLLAHPPGGRPLNPRDVVVMVPDIDAFAPAIRSVFGQHTRGHARHIPWGIADQRDRGHHPLLLALEWLLRAPQQRFAFSELRDLLDVPAVARRFAVSADDLPTLVAWIEGAGVRWGLSAGQRETLGLQACGDVNTWRFGLRRMLLGYATGELEDGHAGIEPYTEVAGLAAGLAGALAELLAQLDDWWAQAAVARPAQAWGQALRSLLQTIFAAAGDTDRALLAALDDALTAWLLACEHAGFDEAVELDVVREAWLEAVDEPGVLRRFKAGGVTFCTLLPMRAIPFEVVCLLGMSDGDYPRRSLRSDFDLMALPGQARPGDRSRRDDDRQLMLDALLSARRVLYVSWVGRSQRDNQLQPASVLVSQLRDYLAAGWGPEVVASRTTAHPLQPFSRAYFEPKREGQVDVGLLTYASEWRAAYADAPALASAQPRTEAAAPTQPGAPKQLNVSQLAQFLRNPVKAFFRHRLQVSFEEIDDTASDDETFVTAGLDRWQLLDEVLRGTRQAMSSAAGLQAPDLVGQVERQVRRLQRAGRLPLGGPGERVADTLVQTLAPMLGHWQLLQAQHPQAHDKRPLQLGHPDRVGLVFDDGLSGLQSSGMAGAAAVWIDLQASKLADKKIEHPRADKLLKAWLRCLATAACGQPAEGWLIGADAVLRVTPPEADGARATLFALMGHCSDGLSGDKPVPTAVQTGLAVLHGVAAARTAFEGSGDFGGATGEGREACLARLYPDFAALQAEPAFEPGSRALYADYGAWLATHVTVEALPEHAAFEEADDE